MFSFWGQKSGCGLKKSGRSQVVKVLYHMTTSKKKKSISAGKMYSRSRDCRYCNNQWSAVHMCTLSYQWSFKSIALQPVVCIVGTSVTIQQKWLFWDAVCYFLPALIILNFIILDRHQIIKTFYLLNISYLLLLVVLLLWLLFIIWLSCPREETGWSCPTVEKYTCRLAADPVRLLSNFLLEGNGLQVNLVVFKGIRMIALMIWKVPNL